MRNIINIGISEARGKLASVIKQVYSHKDAVVLEKGGLPVAAVISMTDFEKLKALAGTDLFDNPFVHFSEWDSEQDKVYDRL